MISGHRPPVVDKTGVIEMLDALSLDNGEDCSSVDSDSDTSEKITAVHEQQSCTTESPPINDSEQKVEPSENATCSDAGLSTKRNKWSGSDRFPRGLLRSCVVDVSSVTASCSESLSSMDQDSVKCHNTDSAETVVHHTRNTRELHETAAVMQTTLERVKACLCEWKTSELVAFLDTESSELTNYGVYLNENMDKSASCTTEVNGDIAENNIDKREEHVKLYERKVNEFYGAKPRVHFADLCEQV